MNQQLGLRIPNETKKQLRVIAAFKEKTITELVIEYIQSGLKVDIQKYNIPKTI